MEGFLSRRKAKIEEMKKIPGIETTIDEAERLLVYAEHIFAARVSGELLCVGDLEYLDSLETEAA